LIHSKFQIQWLLDNYETADGTSLPRCALYDHYKKHCHEHKLDAVNAASFGKLIRSVFNGLRTRRLGTRGNSKYHYYGIRIKADSPLMQNHIPERYSPHEASAPMTRSKSLGQTRLSQQQLFSLCTLPQIQHWVISLDLAFYQTLVDVLVPDVLMSNMSPFLTQSCRNFAKNAEHYLKKAMQGAPEIIQKKKIQAVKYMAQGLRRYTSLNHLAQAARAVLQKPDQVMAMYNDYIRVDMQQVQEQAGWVSGCDSLMVHHIHNAFKENLQKMAPMEEWAEWLESIVDQILAKYHDKPVQIISEIGKQFLLNWSCYTSMLIRDLTLRSAGSFGSFHLIRLLTDEYMVYLVESRIAKAVNRAMITVISQVNLLMTQNELRLKGYRTLTCIYLRNW
uniref:RFX-type winged-helix domain-containing protein n=1 Tax=Angiostrongylus costaricensis TaxID=334426 RepID=A0A158PGH2_ANGCS